MSQQDFLNKFQDSMTKLNTVRGNIQASIQSKEQFANELKTRLQDINGRLQQLAGLIKDLKNKADNLEGQITANSASIGNKDMELQQLREQVAALTTERNAIMEKTAQQDNATKTQMAQLQGQIDNYEVQLRDLKQAAETKTAEVNALRQEMTTRGDAKDATHAQQIAQLTEQSRQQLEQQEAQLKQKEAQLMQRINDCEGKIVGFQQQITQRETMLADKQRQLDEQILQAQNSGTAVQGQIAALKNENEGLIQKLIAATTAIYQSAEDLQMLMASVPNAQTKQEIDALLNTINQQIEQSLQNISRATQGQPMLQGQQPMLQGQQPMLQGQQPMLQGQQPMQGTRIDPNTPITIQGSPITYNQLIQQLGKKGADVTRNTRNQNNKYNIAVNELRSVTNPSQIESVLSKNGISLKNGVVFGGKGKTRKNRKQKGGFIYSLNTKRRNARSKSKSNTKR
jgi:predicted  nucleic acid-binding Zn-ribbon protein